MYCLLCFNRNNVGNILFIPGKSCGIRNAISYIDTDKIRDSLTSVKDIECSIAKSKRSFDMAMERLKTLKGQNAESQTPSDTSQTSDIFDVSQHYPYCQSHPEDKGLILKASTDVIEGCTSAKAFCKDYGMELVVIRTREEFDQIVSFLKTTEVPGELVPFFINGQMNSGMGKFIHPCKANACGSDIIQWDDPGGLPFDSTIYGDSWLEPAPGQRVRHCLSLQLYSKKRETFRGVALSANKHAVCMARCGKYGSRIIHGLRDYYCPQ